MGCSSTRQRTLRADQASRRRSLRTDEFGRGYTVSEIPRQLFFSRAVNSFRFFSSDRSPTRHKALTPVSDCRVRRPLRPRVPEVPRVKSDIARRRSLERPLDGIVRAAALCRPRPSQAPQPRPEEAGQASSIAQFYIRTGGILRHRLHCRRSRGDRMPGPGGDGA